MLDGSDKDANPSFMTMKRLRLWIIALTVWLIFFFNIERIGSPVNIRYYTYIFVAAVVAVTLLLPRLQKLPFIVLLLVPIPIFLWLKAALEKGGWQANLFLDYSLPLTVTQLSAIILTGMLARQIHYGLSEFEAVIANITFSHIGKLPVSFTEGQGPMYREVKRSRRFQRPLGMITIQVDPQTIQVLLPQMIKEVQQVMMKEYVLAAIARILDQNMHDFDTIALRDNSFILVLPETVEEDLPLVVQRLEKAIKENLNVRLNIGTASFPAEAETFERLIEVAQANAAGQHKDVSKTLVSSQKQPFIP